MTQTGLDQIRYETPAGLTGKRIGLLCHAPSVASDYTHIISVFLKKSDCRLAAIFGPSTVSMDRHRTI